MRDQLFNLAAAFAYAAGAICMKSSGAFSKLLPTVMIFVLFCSGAAMQTIAMNKQDVGVSNTIVLGVEAIFAFILAVILFNESVTASKLVAIALVGTGVYLLRA